MKRLLLLTYCWPPRGGVGLFRTWKWATYLPRFGWEVVVLTPGNGPASMWVEPALGELPGVEVLSVPYRTWRPYKPVPPPQAGVPPVRRPDVKVPAWKAALVEALNTPDDLWPWQQAALQAGLQRVAKGDITAILSSSPPESLHVVAHRLKRKTGLPWVADMRDLWSMDHQRRWPGWKRRILQRMERRTLSHADALVSVSPEFLATERTLLARATPHDQVIFNGFDPETMALSPPASYPAFTLLYTGKMHPVFQDPCPLLEAVARLKAARKLTADRFQVHFHLYGAQQPDLSRMAAELGIADLIQQLPVVQPDQVAALQRGAHVLLLVAWHEEQRRGVTPAKLFDYLGAGRPILCLGEPGDPLCRIIAQTGGGVCGNDSAQLAAQLGRWYDEWQATGQLHWSTNQELLEPYTRQFGTRQLANLLHTLTGGGAPD